MNYFKKINKFIGGIYIKKFNFNNDLFRISVYALGVIVCAILFDKILGNVDSIRTTVSAVLNTASNVLQPFIIAFFLAYILNPGVTFIENKLFSKIKQLDNKQNVKRLLSLILTYTVFVGAIVLIVAVIAPEIISSIYNLALWLPKNIRDLESTIEQALLNIELLSDYDINDIINLVFTPLLDFISNLKATDATLAINRVVSSTFGIANGFINIFLGIVISIYMIYDKSVFMHQSVKITKAVLKEKHADTFLAFMKDANKIFQGFVVGKALDSTIIGILCFIGFSIIKPPFAFLLSIIVGVTNMIPYFGPFIGAIPCIIITFFVSPIDALWVALFLLALQQFDGIILGPKILGDSVGVKPFWIIFSVLAGGALFGFLGMFLGVPVFAILKLLLSRFINKKYIKKFPV